MSKCPICGGANTCPAGKYSSVRAPEPGDIATIEVDAPVPPGWIATHRTRRSRVVVREVGQDGMELLLVRSAQSARVRAHYGVEPTWVGQCTYAFYARRRRRHGRGMSN